MSVASPTSVSVSAAFATSVRAIGERRDIPCPRCLGAPTSACLGSSASIAAVGLLIREL